MTENTQCAQKFCWICWDTNTDIPFIRPCLGCKDPELQYAHSTCMNQYINSLPRVNSIDLDLPEGLGLWETIFYRPSLEALPLLDFKCTRCLDSYNVELDYSSRLNSLFRIHKSILFALLGLFVCSAVVIVSSCIILSSGNETFLRSPIFSLFGFKGISLKTWSILLCVLYSLLNVLMWLFVFFKIPPFRIITVLDK
eukprot:NODE_117_length_18986_cov_0.639540.p8 type:complete len:197 gc:universal NODE_117_length_18986_cov_0.639540:2753-3343(+)